MSDENTKTSSQNQKKINTGIRVSWEDKVSDSGIQLTGGSTTVKKCGAVAGVMPMVAGNQQMLCAVIAGDDKQWHVIPLEAVKIL